MTGLETVFIGLGSLALGVISTVIVLSKRFVSCATCVERHKGLDGELQDVTADTAKNRSDIRLAFEILREVVVRLPGVTEADKARILNLRPERPERSA